MSSPVLRCQAIVKSYHEAESQINILQNVSLELQEGETLAILGSSGSGKSTLLHILGTLDSADSGEVFFREESLTSLNAKKQAEFRNKHLGFVYQFHHLLPEFSAQENVAMPLLIAGVDKASALAKAASLLDKVGLSHRINHKPSQMSGGERQRVAIARALVNSPKVIMADEPTGNLDDENSKHIFELIKDINKTLSTAFIIVTHDQSLASKLGRTLVLNRGQLEIQNP
ncbi:lipoprotein-releasing ABC transporter ATP-binding protein LolD [Glaciecola sp. XM2]|uniref:lipoprotein-releasing ABC transporter ATP-binding protein LolD n=1 Tax=Glaciecola sp. XM2 TaxID=1914931 RepID=UPI001BDF3274|nr:lipoprotein-releasing ABC transporter ATP-binding protein LolD [Glaciecola sp. XM2]MBT1449712.1 lipoprotein-releasing ABC transporter ATP-binding protein LolD [Glaciecola sp. XM2]